MTTSFWFYTLLCLMIVLPIVFVAYRRIHSSKKGRRYQLLCSLLVLLVCLGVVGLAVGLHQFSKDYQSFLVGERYATAYGEYLLGRRSADELLSEGFVAMEDEAQTRAFLEAQPRATGEIRFQMSDEMGPKYYSTQPEAFPEITGLKHSWASPCVMLLRQTIDGETVHSYIVLRALPGSDPDVIRRWVVVAQGAASPDMLAFFEAQNFLRAANLLKWFSVK